MSRRGRRGHRNPGQTRRPRVHLVATPGGHLDLLMRLGDAFAEYERRWVVSEGDGATTLSEAGEDVVVLPRFHGFAPRNLRLATASIRPALRERPDLLVTTGSGNVVPYCAVLRALGTPIIFVETMARVTSPSAAGRVLSRMASSVLVQWPEMEAIYPRAQVCEPDLVTRLGEIPATESSGARAGTFLAVGTHLDPFDRVVRMVDEAVGAGVLPTPVRAQVGVSPYRPRTFAARPWMRPAEIDEGMLASEVVICHAGTGLISRSLESGAVPIVVARRASLGEHVDDHQEQIVAKLAAYGLIAEVQGDAITEHDVAALRRMPPPAQMTRNGLPSIKTRVAQEAARLIGDGSRR